MQYPRASRGDPINIQAELWNKLMGIAEGGEFSRPGGIQQSFQNADIVTVRNDSGAAVDRFGILGIDAPVILPTANEDEFTSLIALSCVEPVFSTHKNKFVVLQEPLADGAIGKAVIAGVTPVRVTGTELGFAAVRDGDTEKMGFSASGRTRVLWAESGVLDRWAYVRLNDPPSQTYRYYCVGGTLKEYSSTDGALTYVRDTGVCCNCVGGSGSGPGPCDCNCGLIDTPDVLCVTLTLTSTLSGSCSCMNGWQIELDKIGASPTCCVYMGQGTLCGRSVTAILTNGGNSTSVGDTSWTLTVSDDDTPPGAWGFDGYGFSAIMIVTDCEPFTLTRDPANDSPHFIFAGCVGDFDVLVEEDGTCTGAGGGGGGGSTDCFGAEGGGCTAVGTHPSTLTGTVTNKTGCYTSLPSTLNFVKVDLDGPPATRVYWKCTNTLSFCGCSSTSESSTVYLSCSDTNDFEFIFCSNAAFPTEADCGDPFFATYDYTDEFGGFDLAVTE